jgi:hypothetical protein
MTGTRPLRRARTALALGAIAAAVSLVACSKKAPDPEVTAEIGRRNALRNALMTLDDGGPRDLFRVGSKPDVHFEDGFGTVQFDPPDDYRNHAFRWMGIRGHVRLRTQGDTPMHVRIAGWLHEQVLHQHGSVWATIDGQTISRAVDTDDKGIWVIDERIDPAIFRGREWVDLEIIPSSVAFHWAEPPDLRVIVLFDFVWRRESD